MEMITVSSSNVSAIGYEDGIIQVRFKNGSVYQYFGCSEGLFQSFFECIFKRKICASVFSP